MLEAYKPHTNRKAVGVWLCSAAKRPSKRSALAYIYTGKPAKAAPPSNGNL